MSVGIENSPQGKHVTVMGLGRFGGGVGVCRWLCAQGSRVLLTDMDPAEKLAEPLSQIDPLVREGRVTLALGGHEDRHFTETDLVVVNPAVPKPWSNRYVNAARTSGVPVTSEIVLLIDRLDAALGGRERVIAITGSAGKSTTSSMIHAILHASGRRAVIGGNLGGSLLGELGGAISPGAYVVLELSSAMLYWINEACRRSWSPATAVFTNFAENHLDWHGDVEHYRRSKASILAYQRESDAAVLGAAGPTRVSDWPCAKGARVFTPLIYDAIDGLRVPGSHNAYNAAMAVDACVAAVTRAEGGNGPLLTREAAREFVRSFAGLAHRLQFVSAVGGVSYYNDSKSTTPESTRLAIASFLDLHDKRNKVNRPVHLIAGGYDKGSDLSPLGEMAPRLAGLYTIGVTGPKIAEAARAALFDESERVQECGTIDIAVARASSLARAGDIVLLSPACASWDQFSNYERRGERFVELVRTLTARHGDPGESGGAR